MTDAASSPFELALARAIAAAAEQASRRRHRHIQVEHLLRGLLDEPDARLVLERCGADLDELARELDEYLDLLEEAATTPRPQADRELNALLSRAAMLASSSGKDRIGVGRVLEQMLQMSDRYAALLLHAAGPAGIDLVDLRRVISHGRRDLAPEIPASDRLVVKLHNDDYTTMEFVVAVLTELFGLPLERATQLMMEIHHGEAIAIAELAAKDAVRRVGVVHARAHAKQYPLRCTLAAVPAK